MSEYFSPTVKSLNPNSLAYQVAQGKLAIYLEMQIFSEKY